MSLGLILRRLDYVLLAAVGAAVVYGYLTVASVTGPGTVTKHLIYVGVGCTLALVAAFLDPKLIRKVVWPTYTVLLALLLVVLGLEAARGSSRWISLPGFRFQPSEIGKLVVIVALAAFAADQARERPGTWRAFASSLGLIAAPAALVFVEPDLGTSIVYGATALSVLFVAGARVAQLLLVITGSVVVIVLVVGVLPSAGVRVLQPYQEERLTAFLDPGGSSRAAYQSQQSKNAIGSGALTGKGVEGATVSSAGFLPERHTDFIFAVVGEQRGFIGAALLIGLFVIIVWRAIRTVTLAATLYESLIAAGIAGMLLTQVFVNVGMTLGIMPTTGIPLPFMTYGGSNTLTNLIAVGVLVAIQIRGGVPDPAPFASRESVRAAQRRAAAGA